MMENPDVHVSARFVLAEGGTIVRRTTSDGWTYEQWLFNGHEFIVRMSSHGKDWNVYAPIAGDLEDTPVVLKRLLRTM